ncbi:hypothetical protein M885DRAFT_616962 [Pelagophyceae sp. CCMP2097]|nr:hypothetical protein M885DRAFT_616962 [Pelagophyceae sp. CCMP2097]
MMHSGVLAGVNYMNSAPDMFACATRLNTVTFLEWWYTSQSLLVMAPPCMTTRGYTPLPDFIMSGVLRILISELSCLDEDTGLPRLVKERTETKVTKKGTLYAVELAVKPLVGVTAVYLEHDPAVVWKVAQAANDAALARGYDTGLGIAAVFSVNAPQAPAFFAAPFFTAGVGAQYHLGSTDDLSLTHAELSAIYTCNIKTWAELRPDLPAAPIQLVVRTDACDTNEVFTAALAWHVPSFAQAFGTTRTLDAAQMRLKGCTVVAEVTSEAQVESAVLFYDGALGMWTESKKSTTDRAGFRAADTVLVLDADSLRACEAGSAVTFGSKANGFSSTVYDGNLL